MVDEKKIAFNPAYELSFLKPEEQQVVCGGTVDEAMKNRHRRSRAAADHRYHPGRHPDG